MGLPWMRSVYMLRMDDPSQDPVDVDCQISAGFQSQCTVSTNNPSGDKIVKMKPPDTKPPGTVTLDSLSVEDVCYLLDHSKLNAITSVARENQFSGIILATGVESANDLKEFGIKAMFAQSLFKHILKWKAEGVPADVFTGRVAAAPAVEPTVFPSVGATNMGAGVRLRPTNPTPPISQGVPQQDYSSFGSSSTTNKQSPSNVPRDQAQTEQEKQQEMQWIFALQDATRLAREKKAIEFRDLQTALWALENDLHQNSGRMVLGLGGEYDCPRCCICQPDVVRKNDPRPPSWFQLDCQHNWDLINKVSQLAGESKTMEYRTIAARYSDVLQLGKKRLLDLQRDYNNFV